MRIDGVAALVTGAASAAERSASDDSGERA